MVAWGLTALTAGYLGYAVYNHRPKVGDIVAVPFDKLPVGVPPQLAQLAQAQGQQVGLTVQSFAGGVVTGAPSSLVGPNGVQQVGDLGPAEAPLSVPQSAVTALYRAGKKVA